MYRLIYLSALFWDSNMVTETSRENRLSYIGAR